MWDLPRPGLEPMSLPRPGLKPMSPELAGRFSTTAPPGKPSNRIFDGSIGTFILKLLHVMHGFKQMMNYVGVNGMKQIMNAIMLVFLRTRIFNLG